MKRLSVLLMLVLGVAALQAPARADDGNGQKQDQPQSDRVETPDTGTYFPEQLLPDMGTEAMFGSCDATIDTPCSAPGVTGRTCTQEARNDRSLSGSPGGSNQIQVIFFEPSDRVSLNLNYDRSWSCNDGSYRNSNIGWSEHNDRVWMANQDYASPQSPQIKGLGFKHRIRTVTAYGYTHGFYDVMFVRGNDVDAGYQTNSFTKIRNELNLRGWTNANIKTLVYADVRSIDGCPSGGCAGLGDVNGQFAMAFARMTTNGAYNSNRWGCADEGDSVPIHETLHTFANVNSTAAEYDSGHAWHTVIPNHPQSQQYDALYYIAIRTIRGTYRNGTASGLMMWDQGADSYTARTRNVAANYLGSITAGRYTYHSCA